MTLHIDNIAPLGSEFYLHPEISNEIEPSTSYFEKNKTYFLTFSEQHDDKLDIDPRVEYKLNNFAHRSDDFSKLDSNKTNILFAGCSNTFGHSLPEKYVWTKKLYDSLQFTNKGPFNSIGIPGAGIERVVSNIFKYCNKFGNPDYIFIIHADLTREVKYISEQNKFENQIHLNYKSQTLDSDVDFGFYLVYKFQLLYRLLEIYCKSHNIKLLSSSWDSTNVGISSELFPDTFIKPNNLLEYAKNFDINNIDKSDWDFLVKARDNHHEGIIYHQMMCDLFLSAVSDLTPTL